VVLMGAPADLFDMRRRLEDGTYVPPFGLDQALIALGFPDREPARYRRYSGAYHVRPGGPPTLLVHSRQDDVVPYRQSELLGQQLAAAGVPHEVRLLDGGSHYLLSNEADARAVRDLTLSFLRRYVG
jgi:dipeptidyl aminopeptidase/acylaminoacyl peptidase